MLLQSERTDVTESLSEKAATLRRTVVTEQGWLTAPWVLHVMVLLIKHTVQQFI